MTAESIFCDIDVSGSGAVRPGGPLYMPTPSPSSPMGGILSCDCPCVCVVDILSASLLVCIAPAALTFALLPLERCEGLLSVIVDVERRSRERAERWRKEDEVGLRIVIWRSR